MTVSVDLVKQLEGMAPWQVQQGHGSFVTMDFGAELEHRGEWCLWIQNVSWRVETADEVLAGCEDSREVIGAALARLENQVLRRVDVHRPSLGLTLDFGEAVFQVFPFYTAEYESWYLFTPEGPVLYAGPGAQWGFGE